MHLSECARQEAKPRTPNCTLGTPKGGGPEGVPKEARPCRSRVREGARTCDSTSRTEKDWGRARAATTGSEITDA